MHPICQPMRLVAILVTVLALTGCGRSESYRYKLTLAVNTPTGVKRASSVVEVTFYDVSIPAQGTMHKLNGEALFLELGPGTRPLIALLTNNLPNRSSTKYDDIRWTDDAGPDTKLIMKLAGQTPSPHYMDDVPRIARMRGPHKIGLADLPDLVTFADENDPKSVIQVNSNDLEASLGSNITWNEMTLEISDEPITKGIANKLPWIPEHFKNHLRLDGSKYIDKSDLANRLNWWNFDQSAELMRSR